jgi:cytochrome c-type biogenesis protein
MQEVIGKYYLWLSGLANWLSLPLGDLAYSINVPIISVLLFGLIGATAPCQISGSIAALAYLSRDAGAPQRLWGKTAAFLAGKVTVYSLVGGGIVLLGLQLDQIAPTAIPVAIIARRALGPLLILVGLIMLGLLKSRLSFGGHLSAWIEEKTRGKQGFLPAYFFGVALSFAFCPTLFWLFFGLMIPLAISSTSGLVFPGIFAIGTVIPVLVLASLVASGAINVGQFLNRFRAAEVWIQRGAGVVFILVGFNETMLYWFL